MREIFLALYNLAGPKGVSVADVCDNGRGEGAWNLIFIRPMNDWEVDDAQSFLGLLNSRFLKQGEKDKLFWKGDKKGVYTVRVNVAPLEDKPGRTDPLNMLWNNCVPPKVTLRPLEDLLVRASLRSFFDHLLIELQSPPIMGFSNFVTDFNDKM